MILRVKDERTGQMFYWTCNKFVVFAGMMNNHPKWTRECNPELFNQSSVLIWIKDI